MTSTSLTTDNGVGTWTLELLMTHINLSFRPLSASAKRKQSNPNLIELLLEGLDHKVTIEVPREAMDNLVADMRQIEIKEDDEAADRRQMALFAKMGEPL